MPGYGGLPVCQSIVSARSAHQHQPTAHFPGFSELPLLVPCSQQAMGRNQSLQVHHSTGMYLICSI